MYVTLLSVLAMLPYIVISQSSRLEWAPEDMHNPRMEPAKCGLVEKQPGYICDPNGILGDHVNKFNWVLRDAAYNSTKCPCSNYYCETARRPLGYKISMALVKKMKITTHIDGRRVTPQDQAQLFAYRLENSLWKMGMCEEDIVIFYSLEDKMLAISGGPTAIKKLTPYYRQLLAYKIASRLKEGKLVEAFNNLLVDLKLVLNCDSGDVDCNLHVDGTASLTSISFSVVLLSALVTVYNIWS